jgi:hypothetical protein
VSQQEQDLKAIIAELKRAGFRPGVKRDTIEAEGNLGGYEATVTMKQCPVLRRYLTAKESQK